MTPIPRHALVVVFAILVSSSPLLAQEPPGGKAAPPKEAASTRPAPKDPAEVLAGMREALAGAPVWGCRSKWGGGMMGLFPGADSTIVLRHDAGGRITGVRLMGNFTPRIPRFVAVSSDGEKLRAVDLDEKIYEDAPWSPEQIMMAPPVGPGGADVHVLQWVVPLEFWQLSDMVPAKKDKVTSGGTATSDGVLCDMVDLERGLPEIESEVGAGARQITRYVVGRDDHLPRRIIKKWPAQGAGAITASTSYELTAWKLNPALDERTFEVDVAGMKAGKFKIPFVQDSSMGPPGGIPEGLKGGGPSMGVKAGDKPSDFALKDIAGKEHKLSAYKGKAVLVHFSTLDSDASDGLLAKMKSKHGDKLVILDLVVDHDKGGLDAVKKAKKPAAWPRLVGGEAVADSWGVNMLSSGVVIGPDGKVAASWPTGVVSKNADQGFDVYVKKMGEYLKNPAKGW